MLSNSFREMKGNYATKVRSMFSHFKKSIPLEKRDHYDYTQFSFDKRIDIAINGIDNVKAHLKGVCSDSELEAYFAVSNMLVMRGGYNHAVDYCNSASLAAAIWILDQLTLAGKLKDSYQFLPDISDEELEEEFLIPIVNHPVYDNNLILSVVKLIRLRNTNEDIKEKKYGSIMSNTGKAITTPTRNRQAFESVIGLIDKHAINRATKQYEDDIWNFYSLAFRMYKLIDDKVAKLERELEEVQNSNLNNLFPKNRSALVAPHSGLKALNNGLYQDTGRIYTLMGELDRLEDITLTELSLVNDREKTVRKLRKLIPASKNLGEELLSFRVADPFESAFALLYLLDTGDPLPWYYYGSISVAYTMCDQFPYDVALDKKVIDFNRPVLTSGLNDVLYTHKYKGYRWPEKTDASGEPVQRENAKNLAQMLYLMSGSLIPRVIPHENLLDNFFDDVEALTEREKEAFSLLIFTLNSGHLRDNGYTWHRLENELESDKSNEIETEEAKNNSVDEADDLITENKRLKDKNARLISILRESLLQSRNDQKMLEAATDEYKRQRIELSDLREKIFLLTHEDTEEKPDDIEVEYPYYSRKRIVSFGGHVSWINEMKKKLPNVVFVSPDVLPNIDLIRRADEVWIQTNCISHKDYYRIMDTLKNVGKQIRYFVYSGVGKCAEQLVKSCENKE